MRDLVSRHKLDLAKRDVQNAGDLDLPPEVRKMDSLLGGPVRRQQVAAG
jgi:hypothetical protein